MAYSSSVWFDFTGSLALIVVLTGAYGYVKRRLFTHQQSQMLLGLAFGGVACLQMNMPIEPVEGLILDLRNVPMVLCGAFLGMRAALLCFAMAVMTRYGIGGLGMWAGLMGLTISLLVGAAWAWLTRSDSSRRFTHLVVLAIASSGHLGAGFVLPDATQAWFFANAAIPLGVMNFASILIAAYMLDQEQGKITRENRLAAAVVCDPDHGALTRPAFEREIQLRVNAGTMQAPAALMVVKLRHTSALFSIVPSILRNKILGLIRIRLKQAFVNADLVCALDSTALIVPLDTNQFLNRADVEHDVMQLMRSEPFQVSNDISKLIAVDTKVFSWSRGGSLEATLRSIKFSFLPKRKNSDNWAAQKPKIPEVLKLNVALVASPTLSDQSTTADLFGKAEVLMGSRHVS
jgi:hypothetical protein